MQLEDKDYYNKYRQYFEYNGFHKVYHYMFDVENYNDNKTWPLKSCIKCGHNFKTDPPFHRGINIDFRTGSPILHDMKPLIGKGVQYFIAILYVCPVILLFFGQITYAISLIITITLIIAATEFVNLMKDNKAIIFYYCPNCRALLYNKKANPLITQNPPRVVFKELEKIPGFKLK